MTSMQAKISHRTFAVNTKHMTDNYPANQKQPHKFNCQNILHSCQIISAIEL